MINKLSTEDLAEADRIMDEHAPVPFFSSAPAVTAARRIAFRDAIASALASARTAAAEDMRERWKPIGTAPKDGQHILYSNRFKEIGHCRWCDTDEDGEEVAWWWDDERDDEVVPLWWMTALPTPPDAPSVPCL